MKQIIVYIVYGKSGLSLEILNTMFKGTFMGHIRDSSRGILILPP